MCLFFLFIPFTGPFGSSVIWDQVEKLGKGGIIGSVRNSGGQIELRLPI
jgi:hypothetical protein